MRNLQIERKLMRETEKRSASMNKRGVVGMDVAKAFMLIILTIGVIAFAVIIAVANLNSSTVLTSGSYEKNQSTNIFNNITGGLGTFFSNTGTFFTLLAVTVIILIIGLVIFAVNRFGGGSSGGTL